MSGAVRANGFALAGLLFVAGLVGIASLLTMPLETLKPEGLVMDDSLFRILALINPTLLLLIAVALGTPAARAVGLRAPLAEALLTRQPVGEALRPMVQPAALTALACALVLIAYGAWTSATGVFSAEASAQAGPTLTTRLLYGGITEEILMRWGGLSILAWLFTRVSKSPISYWLANLGAAMLFAVGHLPALFAAVPDASGLLVAAVLIGNLLPGLLFGWLYWRKGLEAAILAHGGAHLIAWSVMSLTA